MRKAILDYLQTQQTGVLAIEMLDGSPHAATVHFAYSTWPFVFFFETYKEYRKAEALLGREKSRASFVVGTDEKTTATFQLDGYVEIINEKDKEIFDSVYFGKFPNKIKKSQDAKFLCFKFTPTWWRYTEWTKSDGKIILNSENIDVLNEAGEKTGEVRLIDDIHCFGLWHSSARVWIYNSNKEILLQERDKSSMEYPNKWDVSAAGHISAGDDSLGTAVGEIKEELGLDVETSELVSIARLTKRDVSSDGLYIDNSFEDIYVIKKDIDIKHLKMEKGEVQNLRWVPVEEFKTMVENRSTELVPHWDEYELVVKEISKY